MQAIDEFGRGRVAATSWVVEYQRAGRDFCFAEFKEQEHNAWLRMRHARYNLIAAGQVIVQSDARWLLFKRGSGGLRPYRSLNRQRS
jgi:hypothetical protein